MSYGNLPPFERFRVLSTHLLLFKLFARRVLLYSHAFLAGISSSVLDCSSQSGRTAQIGCGLRLREDETD